MNVDEIKKRLTDAVGEFLHFDEELLKNDVHEQAISHKIAVYLEPLFEGFKVDCEYNKHLDKHKIVKVNIILKDYKLCGCSACLKILKNNVEGIKEKSVRLDILVHIRKGKDLSTNNLLAIEIKKNKVCPFDLAKLKALTDQNGDYKYKLGTFIYFLNNQPSYKWIVDGDEKQL